MHMEWKIISSILIFSLRICFIIIPWLHVVAEIVFKNACRPLNKWRRNGSVCRSLEAVFGMEKTTEGESSTSTTFRVWGCIIANPLERPVYGRNKSPPALSHCLPYWSVDRFKCRGSGDKLKTCLSRSCQPSLVSIVPYRKEGWIIQH